MTYNAGPYRLKTHALLKGSPALDRIETTSGSGITDARGFPRFVPGFWDLGAYEGGPLETELLKVLEQSADEHRVNAENYLSNGLGTILSADAVGDYLVYEAAVAEPGIHDIAIRGKGGPSRGIYRAEAFIDDGWKTIGEADLYRSSPGFLTRAVGSIEFKNGGLHRFRLTVAGKNRRSTGYMGYFDYIEMIKRDAP